MVLYLLFCVLLSLSVTLPRATSPKGRGLELIWLSLWESSRKAGERAK